MGGAYPGASELAAAAPAGFLDGGAQDLGDAPGLGDAAQRGMRRLGAEDLGDRADAGLAEVGDEARQQLARLGAPLLAAYAHHGGEIGPEQPGPDRALVIGAVALRGGARGDGAVGGIVGRERPQADRGPGLGADA